MRNTMGYWELLVADIVDVIKLKYYKIRETKLEDIIIYNIVLYITLFREYEYNNNIYHR